MSSGRYAYAYDQDTIKGAPEEEEDEGELETDSAEEMDDMVGGFVWFCMAARVLV